MDWFLYDRDLRLERVKGFNVVVKSFFERIFLNSKVNFFGVIRLGRSEESVFFNLITKKKVYFEVSEKLLLRN